MNRKQFFIAVFTAIIGAKRWRKLFPPKRSMLMNPAFIPYYTRGSGSLFNPTSDLHTLYMKPLVLHPNAFSMVYPKIGCTLDIRKPAGFVASIESDVV